MKKTQYFLFLLTVCALKCFSGGIFAENAFLKPKGIYACLLCDTSNKQMKKYHLEDIATMKETLQYVAACCNVSLAIHVIKGKALTLQNIKKEAEKASKGNYHHCRFLYYTGSQGKRKAYLDCFSLIKCKKQKKFVSLSPKEWRQLFCARSFFTLTLIDAYDKIINRAKILRNFFENKKGKSSDMLLNCFFRQQGMLTVGVRNKMKKGGLLTHLFCSALYQQKYTEWKQVMQELQADCGKETVSMDMSQLEPQGTKMLAK